MKTAPDPLREPRFADTLARLRAQAGPDPAPGFADRTLARARAAGRRQYWMTALRRAAAAVVLLASAGVWFIRAPHPALVAQAPAPVEILMAAQRADGGWSADAQNLRARYDVGLTALALLALMQSDPAPLEGPHAAAIRAGIAHLVRQQRADGRFGADFSGTAFTQYLAGMAVQSASRLVHADPAWSRAAVRAAPHLPSEIQMAKLNSNLANPEMFPERWADAGGPVARAAIELLRR